MSKQIFIGRVPLRERIEIIIDEEGAEYIASVMEQYQGRDALARQITEAIREALSDDH